VLLLATGALHCNTDALVRDSLRHLLHRSLWRGSMSAADAQAEVEAGRTALWSAGAPEMLRKG
jgi:hypothetical protein